MRKPRESSGTREQPPALHYAVRLLSARPYSERKLREKLKDRGYEAGDVAAAIARLKEKKLLDDRVFAEEFVRARCGSHPRGRSALIRDLIGRGIPADLASDVVIAIVPDDEEKQLARRLLERKSPQYKSLAPDARKRRLAGLLARRGFRPQTIFHLLGQEFDTDDH